MRADLAHLSPQTHPGAFVNAAVLSPTDPAMSTSDAALVLLEAEAERCEFSRVSAGGNEWRRLFNRGQLVERAIRNIRQLREAKR